MFLLGSETKMGQMRHEHAKFEMGHKWDKWDNDKAQTWIILRRMVQWTMPFWESDKNPTAEGGHWKQLINGSNGP